MKRQNKTMKHKSKHRVFLFIVKIKIKYLNNFIKTNLGQYLSKHVFKEQAILDEILQEHENTQY